MLGRSLQWSNSSRHCVSNCCFIWTLQQQFHFHKKVVRYLKYNVQNLSSKSMDGSNSKITVSNISHDAWHHYNNSVIIAEDLIVWNQWGAPLIASRGRIALIPENVQSHVSGGKSGSCDSHARGVVEIKNISALKPHFTSAFRTSRRYEASPATELHTTNTGSHLMDTDSKLFGRVSRYSISKLSVLAMKRLSNVMLHSVVNLMVAMAN